MKTEISPHPNIVPLAVCLLSVSATCVFSQGSLTPPPGPPSPTMKTLEQIEPRKPISSLPYTISAPGSYYVTGNLYGPDGISIEADDVDLDLNGFTLTGATNLVSQAAGIKVVQSHFNIRVREGGVRQWLAVYGGVYAPGARFSHFRSISSISNATFGFYLSEGSTAENCRSAFNVIGIYCGNAATVRNSLVSSNFGGIYGALSSTIQGCTAFSNLVYGIELGFNCRVVENTCNFNAIGISVQGDRNRIDSNIAHENTMRGIHVVSGTGNLIIRNHASANGCNQDFVIPAGNKYGQIITINSSITSGSGWENFSDHCPE